MKKGNLRTKRIYPEKGKIKFVIEVKINGKWKIVGKDKNLLIFDSQEDANNSLLNIFAICKLPFKNVLNDHIDVLNLKTRAE